MELSMTSDKLSTGFALQNEMTSMRSVDTQLSHLNTLTKAERLRVRIRTERTNDGMDLFLTRVERPKL